MIDSEIKKEFSKNVTNFLNKIQVLLFKLNSGSELLPKDVKSLEFLKYIIKVENEYTKSDATDFNIDVSDDEVNNDVDNDVDNEVNNDDESYMIMSDDGKFNPPRIKFDTTTPEAQNLIKIFNLDNLDEDLPEDDDLPPIDFDSLKKDADDITKEHLEFINYKKHTCWFNTIKTSLKKEFENKIKKRQDQYQTESLNKVNSGIIKSLNTSMNSIPLSA